MIRRIMFILYAILFFTLIACTSTGNNGRNTIQVDDLVSEYITLSQEYIALEDYDKALELALRAEMYTKNRNDIYYLIARSAALAESWQTSLTYYEKILQQDPENILMKKSIAWIYAQSGDIVKAERLLEELYSTHSFDKEISSNYILLLIASDNYEKAKVILDEYAKMYPNESNIEDLQNKLNETSTLENIESSKINELDSTSDEQ